MAVTQDQIDSFHRFASDRIANGGADLSFQEIVALWVFPNKGTKCVIGIAIRGARLNSQLVWDGLCEPRRMELRKPSMLGMLADLDQVGLGR
jgi:hypothetical protein